MIAIEVAAVLILCIQLVIMTNPGQNRPERGGVHSRTRSTRAMMAAVQFLALLCVGLAIPANVYGIGLLRTSPWLNAAGALLMASGLVIRVYSMRRLGRYYSTILFVNKDQPLVTEGLYGIIRHPIYLGDLLLYVTAGIAAGNWIVLLVVSLTCIPAYAVRMRQEEEMMVENYGQAYVEYRKRTRKIIPLLY